MITYGLLGEKLGHSFSPQIHNALWGCSDYVLHPVPREEAEAFFVKREFQGVNVTIPYKQLACKSCDHVDPKALAIGAVNTVVNREGILYGYNTDYDGFLFCTRRAGINFENKKVLILGDGGTSLTARTAAADAGAKEIVVLSRRAAHSDVPAGTAGVTRTCPLYTDNYEDLGSRHGDAEVVVNTTPVGMFPNNDARPVDLSLFPKLCGVMDVVYNPEETRLVHQASELKVPATCGLPMLVAQAAYAATHFIGRTFTDAEIEEAYAALRRDVRNIVLIGMPGSGKSTVGRILSRITGRECVDIDAQIVAKEGRPIPEIFSTEGEAYFRKVETEVAKEVGARTGIIISCGGGLPTRMENHVPMKQNGEIFYLSRDLSCLAVNGRPLSAGRDPEAMLAERKPFYEAMTDHVIRVREGRPGSAARAILTRYNGGRKRKTKEEKK